MKIIALLPMKGHSERVPNKNIRLFNGEPLFFISLKKLLKIDIIDKIIINTDSNEISQLASQFGEKITVHVRPEKLRGDFISMNEIIEYDLNNSNGDVYIQTHSTSPLLLAESIKKALKLFINSDNYDSIFSVSEYYSRFYFKNLKPINHNPQELIRTQDLEPIYEENSGFYIFSKESFFNNGSKRIGKTPFPFPIDKFESVDIDEEYDFLLAEMIYKNFEKYQ